MASKLLKPFARNQKRFAAWLADRFTKVEAASGL
jgi:hypothetical protein